MPASTERVSRAMSIAGAGSLLMAVLSVPSSSRRRMPASPSPASSSATTSSRRGSAAGCSESTKALNFGLRSARPRASAWAVRKSRQMSITRSAVAAPISWMWPEICSANVFASSSWTLSLFSFDFISVAMIGSTPLRRSQMSLAMSTMPMPPATTETRRARTLPTMR